MLIILSLAALASMLLTIRATELQLSTQRYIFKPLTTVLILTIAVLQPELSSSYYKWMIVAGLAFSLAGDVFLMLPADRFIAGLASFLIAHLFYIAAFLFDTGLTWIWWHMLPMAFYTAALLAILLPKVQAGKFPVFVYAVVLGVMAWAAWERWMQLGHLRAEYAALGAALFVASDSALAGKRFLGDYKHAEVAILGTYFPAQWLIALSIF